MQIKIKIPRKVVTAWDRFCDWGNVPVPGLSFHGYEVVRLDFVNLVGLIITVVTGYYGYGPGEGWWGALLAFLSYVLVAMCALWFF